MVPTKPTPVSKCRSGTTVDNLNYLFASLLHPPVNRPCSKHKMQRAEGLLPWPEKLVPLPVFWNDVKMKSTLGLSQKQHWKSTASPKKPSHFWINTECAGWWDERERKMMSIGKFLKQKYFRSVLQCTYFLLMSQETTSFYIKPELQLLQLICLKFL